MICLEHTWNGMKVSNILSLVQYFYYLQAVYYAIKFCVMAVCNTLAYCWYPTKEWCVHCCDACHRCCNPHDDDAYNSFDDT